MASANFNQPSPAEQAQLRELLAQPVPEGIAPPALFAQFVAKEAAAVRLGDMDLKLRVYQQWLEISPQSVPAVNYAIALSNSGNTGKAVQVLENAINQRKPDASREQMRWTYANFLGDLGQDAKAREARTQVSENIHALQQQNPSNDDRRRLAFLESTVLCHASLDDLNHGKLLDSVEPAHASVVAARDGLQLSKELPRNEKNRTDLLIDAGNFVSALQCLERAYQASGDYGKAEAVLGEVIQTAEDYALNPIHLVTTYTTAGNLRFDLKEFSVAEAHFRSADARAKAMGFTATHGNRLNLARLRIAALEGQKKWSAALSELELLDTLAGPDAALKNSVQFPLIRGYAYLRGNVKTEQAAQLLTQFAANVAKRYPAQHFYAAQARGLQGVALWRLGTVPARAQALPLLASAVQAYMLADNLVYETKGINQDIRDLIFASYLEATFATPAQDAMNAMVAADWVRGGVVQEALADAAVRSALVIPALADLVRSDQDAKNEIEILRSTLAGDSETARPLSPDDIAKLRARIDTLDASRNTLHATIKAGAPDYDNLVRPVPPTQADLSAALQRDEVLVMLLPTENATYVWAVGGDGVNASARVNVTRAQLEQRVHAIRLTLDFAVMGTRITPFDTVDSNTLYQMLLAPVAASLQGKKHLIVAAGGVLGQIPFGVLLTQPFDKVNADAPWLIKQFAVTHVPSLSAWLAVKRFAKTNSAAEAFIAWGDPKFGIAAKVASDDATGTRHVALKRSVRSASIEIEPTRSALRYSDIPALPETRDELLSIASALHADPKHDLHLGERATKLSVLQSSTDGELQRKKVVAFATHGLMAGDLPHLSQPALALAGTGNEAKEPLSALLTLDEVLNLKLNADWVILSACNTAAADGRADEALSGLARGFFYAGSRSLLVTHWSVESESAKQITTKTMDYYTAHPTERKAESLRQAMLTVMGNPQYAHPAYWAPYALTGEGGR